jgi:hypothetical protein
MLGYDKSSAVFEAIMNEYHAQIDAFIKKEDEILAVKARKIEQVSGEICAASIIGRDEYEELIGGHLTFSEYSKRVTAFWEKFNLEKIAEKQDQWRKEHRGRIDHFCSNGSDSRTLYDYNVNIFHFNEKQLSDTVRKILDISDEDLPVYVHNFDQFISSYATITVYLKKGLI